MIASAGRRAAVALGVLACSIVATAGSGGQALPEPGPFLAETRAHLRSDASVLRAYSYRRTVVERERDDEGRVVESHSKTWQVHPLPDDPEGFRFLLERDGRPEPRSAVAAHEAEYRRRLERARRTADTPIERARRRALGEERRRQEADLITDIVGLYEMTLVGRDTVAGQPCIRVSFVPRAGFVPRTRNGRVLQSVRGEGCVSESAHEVLKVQAVAAEPIRYGWGILARVAPGASATIERRPMPTGDWLPVRYDLAGRARVLMLRTVARDATVTFSGFEQAPRDAVVP